nr:unnamed protein product [Callosobruchus analis]
MDLSALNDYIDKSDSDCGSVPQIEQGGDTNAFSNKNNELGSGLSTYFVPQPEEAPFAAGESENFYPKDDDDDE